MTEITIPAITAIVIKCALMSFRAISQNITGWLMASATRPENYSHLTAIVFGGSICLPSISKMGSTYHIIADIPAKNTARAWYNNISELSPPKYQKISQSPSDVQKNMQSSPPATITIRHTIQKNRKNASNNGSGRYRCRYKPIHHVRRDRKLNNSLHFPQSRR